MDFQPSIHGTTIAVVFGANDFELLPTHSAKVTTTHATKDSRRVTAEQAYMADSPTVSSETFPGEIATIIFVDCETTCGKEIGPLWLNSPTYLRLVSLLKTRQRPEGETAEEEADVIVKAAKTLVAAGEAAAKNGSGMDGRVTVIIFGPGEYARCELPSGYAAIDNKPVTKDNAYQANSVGGIELAQFMPMAPQLVLVECGFASPLDKAFPEPIVLNADEYVEFLQSMLPEAPSAEDVATSALDMPESAGPNGLMAGANTVKGVALARMVANRIQPADKQGA